METFCRLCALKSDNFLDVYKEEGLKLNLVNKIKRCLQIWLIPDDTLPKTVCINCCKKVEEYSAFCNLVSQSQVTLVEIFSGERDSSNDVDLSEIKPPKNAGGNSYSEKSEQDRGIQEVDYGVECLLEDKCGKTSNPKACEKNENNEAQTKTILRDESDQEGEEMFYGDALGIRNSFEGYIWKCTDCEEELSSLSSLKTHHQNAHNQSPNFKCNTCSKVYSRYRSFARHVKLHGDPKKYSCEICGKAFSQKTVLQSHRTVHSEERPHVCPQCGKAFKQFSSLYLHSKCHLPDQAKPKFPCKICPKVFSTKHTLETHMKIHTGERNFVCDMCGKSFIAKGSLDYHMLTHNDAKPHACSVCGKGFKTARLLSKHSTLHTGIKPHQCDVCGKQFRERGALKEHNRIHTGAMPYSCEFCGKLFRFKGILTVHRRQHTGERPYSCGECNRDFTNWANYNKHMKRRHRGSDQLDQRIVNRQSTVLVQNEPVQNIGVQPMQPSATYSDANESVYKLPDEHDVYRLTSYQGALQMGSMNYYIPPIHTGVLQRNQ